MKALSVQHVSHAFGDHRVLHDVNLDVAAGQVVALVGPSGCGKSTLLRAILGTHPPNQGTILADGQPVRGPTRNVGIVYQHYSLYDFLTAQKNVAFGPMLDETSILYRTFCLLKWRAKRRRHLEEAVCLLEKVGLGEAIDQYPSQMSGGMRQRVAIAQALIMKPKVLLLDEPFGALDEATREELQRMLLDLYQENVQAKREGRQPPHTIVLVTHELNEAIYVADRVIGLSQFHSGGEQGATIVYDKAAPVFDTSQPKDLAALVQQREELRRIVFDPDRLQDRDEYVTFWKDEAGKMSEEGNHQ
ncbi:MAG: ABC transporter ATP-binding protein [Pirellulales bacterium]|nr:ABC transporter ATP-binding protein [Pirellulales bacterium]